MEVDPPQTQIKEGSLDQLVQNFEQLSLDIQFNQNIFESSDVSNGKGFIANNVFKPENTQVITELYEKITSFDDLKSKEGLLTLALLLHLEAKDHLKIKEMYRKVFIMQANGLNQRQYTNIGLYFKILSMSIVFINIKRNEF